MNQINILNQPVSQQAEQALDQLNRLDPNYPVPEAVTVLNRQENRHLLEYVESDPFGAHVFPGNIDDYPITQFLDSLNHQLANGKAIHLWSYIPTCRYKCHFCQYPVEVVRGAGDKVNDKLSGWVDLNIKEAKLWLKQVPNLRDVPIGEFNVFGGTPSLLPNDLIEKLLSFYKDNFNFSESTLIRFEGEPRSMTRSQLETLHKLGCRKISFGTQSFNEDILTKSGRQHSYDDCVRVVRDAKEIGIDWVSVDLMYGLLDQRVSDVEQDIKLGRSLDVEAMVCTKLHLKSYSETRTGVTGKSGAAWQNPKFREKVAAAGGYWPGLGEQYQMREVITKQLDGLYNEYPTMYFTKMGLEPERWKWLMVDQKTQRAEVAIGLGGSSSCEKSEAINIVHPTKYQESIDNGVLPIENTTGFTEIARKQRSIVMALSTLQPLRNDLFQERFPQDSIFDGQWKPVFESLQERGFLNIDDQQETVTLTTVGKTLVEAIINTEFNC